MGRAVLRGFGAGPLVDQANSRNTPPGAEEDTKVIKAFEEFSPRFKRGRGSGMQVNPTSSGGSNEAEHGPLIVPGKRQTGVCEELLRCQIARLARNFAHHDFPLDLVLGGFISAMGTRLWRRAVRPIRDLMNPRPRNAPSEDHSRSAIVIPAGSIAQETCEVREMRLI
jgi:hypothetical protein